MYQDNDYHFADSQSSISVKSAGSLEDKDFQQNFEPDHSVGIQQIENPELQHSSVSYYQGSNEGSLIDSLLLIKQQIRRQRQQSPHFVQDDNKDPYDSTELIMELHQQKQSNQQTKIVSKNIIQQKQQQEKNISKCEECHNLFNNQQNNKICKTCSDKGLDQIHCPYCGDEIVREFAKDHFEDCIAYIEDQFKVLDNLKECSICMGEITSKLKQLQCKHYFHDDCLDDWLKKKKECPVCRQKL